MKNNMPLYKKVNTTRPEGVLGITNCFGLAVFDISGEECIAAFHGTDGYYKAHRHMIHYSTAGRPFIRKGGTRWYLDQFTRVIA